MTLSPRRVFTIYIGTLTATWLVLVAVLTLWVSSWYEIQSVLQSANREQPSVAVHILRTPASPAADTPDLRTLAGTAASLCGVDPELFWRLIERESGPGGNIHARGKAGELGAAQIKPSTLHHVSPTLRPWVPFDRLLGASCYLRMMYQRHQGAEEERWFAALLDYRYGPNRKSTPSTRYARRIMRRES